MANASNSSRWPSEGRHVMRLQPLVADRRSRRHSPPAARSAAAPSSPPAGFQRIVDDTGTIAISVPADWGNISTAPAVAPDRTVNPIIYASRPLGNDAFPSAERLGRAVPRRRHDPGHRVVPIELEQPYAQGDFSGQRTWFTGCDGGLLYQDVVVGDSTQQFTVTVSFAYLSADRSNRPSTRSRAASSCSPPSTRRLRRPGPSGASSAATKRPRARSVGGVVTAPCRRRSRPRRSGRTGRSGTSRNWAANRCAAPAAAARARSAT